MSQMSKKKLSGAWDSLGLILFFCRFLERTRKEGGNNKRYLSPTGTKEQTSRKSRGPDAIEEILPELQGDVDLFTSLVISFHLDLARIIFRFSSFDSLFQLYRSTWHHVASSPIPSSDHIRCSGRRDLLPLFAVTRLEQYSD